MSRAPRRRNTSEGLPAAPRRLASPAPQTNAAPEKVLTMTGLPSREVSVRFNRLPEKCVNEKLTVFEKCETTATAIAGNLSKVTKSLCRLRQSDWSLSFVGGSSHHVVLHGHLHCPSLFRIRNAHLQSHLCFLFRVTYLGVFGVSTHAYLSCV